MKKATLVLFILLTAISTNLMAHSFDSKEAQNYFLFEPNLQLNVPEIDGLSYGTLSELVSNLSEGTLLKKTFFMNGYNAVFINFETYEDLSNYLNSNGIKNKLSSTCEDICFISTYESFLYDELTLSQDFLNNHHYRFYLLKDIVSSGHTLFGEYEILSANKPTDDAYIQNLIESGKINGTVKSSSSRISPNTQQTIETQLNLFILVMILIFISITLMDYFNNIRRVSVLKILGYSSKDIFMNIGLPNIFFICSVQLLLIVIITLNPSTRNVDFIQSICIFNLLIIFLYITTSFFVMLLINRFLLVSNALKKASFSGRLVSISTVVKLTVGVLLLTTCFDVVKRISHTYQDLREGRAYEPVFDVVRFNGFFENEIDELEFSKRSINFYSLLNSYGELDFVFANFIEFFPITNPDVYYERTDPESIVLDLQNYEHKLNIPMGEVDRNYLRKYEIQPYNEAGKPLNLEETLYEYSILIPESERPHLDKIKSFTEHDSRPKSFQLAHEVHYPITYYFYNDQPLPSLDPKVNPSLLIDSPILYVMDTPTFLNFDEGGSLILGGDSPVKFFKLEQELKQDLYKKIEPFLISSNLDPFIDLSLFLSYGEEYGQVSNHALLIIYNDLVFLLIILSIYIMISMQLNTLEFESDLQDIAVKKYLGFSTIQTFINLIVLNLVVLALIILSSCVIYILLDKQLSPKIITPIILICLIDLICLVLFFRYLKIGKLESILKGKR